MTASDALSRRVFLARVGVLGAAFGTGGLLRSDIAGAGPLQLPPVGVGTLQPVLAELARDTLNGLTTFVVPGPDAYSRSQGTPRTEPGALDAKATDFMIEALDNFVPLPQELLRPVVTGLATASADLGIPLPLELQQLLPDTVSRLDRLLGLVLADDETLPLSLVIALLLNLVATQVNPLAINGPFLSPFARLSYADKAKAFSLVEGADPDIVGVLDASLPEPLHESVSGLLRFVGGALLEFPAFGSYSEWAVFDRTTRTLTSTPVGWGLTGYGGTSDGWDELKGYYQDRTEVSD